MAEKKNENKKGGDGEKKEKGPVVLKVNCLCNGCFDKINKYIRQFEGVESVKPDSSSNKVTVVGAVDPVAIKEKLEKKTKKKVDLILPQPKVDLILPQPKKDDNQEKKKEKKTDKEASVTTAVLMVQMKCQCRECIVKVTKIFCETKGVQHWKIDKQKELVIVKGTMDVKALAKALKVEPKKNVDKVLQVQIKCQCQRCIDKVEKIVSETKGWQHWKIDKQGLLTVKGTMDGKALAEALKGKLKKDVEIVPPKKDGGVKNKTNKNKGGNGGGDGGGGPKLEGRRREFMISVFAHYG